MLITRTKNFIDNIYYVKIEVTDLTIQERDLLEKYGEPLIDLGGDFNSFTAPHYYRKFYSFSPHSYYNASETKVLDWLNAVEIRIHEAIDFLKGLNDNNWTGTVVHPLWTGSFIRYKDGSLQTVAEKFEELNNDLDNIELTPGPQGPQGQSGGGGAPVIEEYEEEVSITIDALKAGTVENIPEFKRYKTQKNLTRNAWDHLKYKYFKIYSYAEDRWSDYLQFPLENNFTDYVANKRGFLIIKVFDKINLEKPIRQIQFRNRLFDLFGNISKFNSEFNGDVLSTIADWYGSLKGYTYSASNLGVDSSFFTFQYHNKNFYTVPMIEAPFFVSKGNTSAILALDGGDWGTSSPSPKTMYTGDSKTFLLTYLEDNASFEFVNFNDTEDKNFSRSAVFVYGIEIQKDFGPEICFYVGPLNFHEFLLDKYYFDSDLERIELKVEFYNNTRPNYYLIEPQGEIDNKWIFNIFKCDFSQYMKTNGRKFPKSIKFCIRNIEDGSRTKWFNAFVIKRSKNRLFKIRFLPDRI